MYIKHSHWKRRVTFRRIWVQELGRSKHILAKKCKKCYYYTITTINSIVARVGITYWYKYLYIISVDCNYCTITQYIYLYWYTWYSMLPVCITWSYTNYYQVLPGTTPRRKRKCQKPDQSLRRCLGVFVFKNTSSARLARNHWSLRYMYYYCYH